LKVYLITKKSIVEDDWLQILMRIMQVEIRNKQAFAETKAHVEALIIHQLPKSHFDLKMADTNLSSKVHHSKANRS